MPGGLEEADKPPVPVIPPTPELLAPFLQHLPVSAVLQRADSFAGAITAAGAGVIGSREATAAAAAAGTVGNKEATAAAAGGATGTTAAAVGTVSSSSHKGASATGVPDRAPAGRNERRQHQEHLDKKKQERVNERLKGYLAAKADMEGMLVKPI